MTHEEIVEEQFVKEKLKEREIFAKGFMAGWMSLSCLFFVLSLLDIWF